MVLLLVGVGVLVALTTVLFGFGGGFVTVPVIAWSHAGAAGPALAVATATSLATMCVNSAVATATSSRSVLGLLRERRLLLVLLGVGGMAGAWTSRVAPAGVARWGFVAYLAVTVLDLLTRPGFFHPCTVERRPDLHRGVPDAVGIPIGAVAAFLGVGGSVMTVPALRRSGASMAMAAALANPLTLAIAVPAAAVTLLAASVPVSSAGMVGDVDLAAAGALMAGSTPTMLLMRRHPIVLADGVHAWGYLALLITAGVAVALR